MAGERHAVPPRLRDFRADGPGSVLLDLEGAIARLCLADDGSVRLRAASGSSLPPDPAPALDREPWRPSSARPEAREGGGLRIVHDGPGGAAYVEVAADPLCVRIQTRSRVTVAELCDLAFSRDGRATVSLVTRPRERFFGFGERTGALDKRGGRIRLRNRDAPHGSRDVPLYASIPFFLGLAPGDSRDAARGVFLDAFAPSQFDVAKQVPDRVRMETDAGGIDITCFPGPNPADVLRRFTARVGRAPRPPLWALGHHQSRWSYRSARAVRKLAAEIRRRRIPTDAIHLDIDYMRGFRVFTWNEKRFPDPRGLLADLARDGFRVVTIVDPGVKVDPEYRVFQEGARNGFFCANADGALPRLRVWPGRAALPDFNRSDVRAWWGEQHRELVRDGVAGIWNDMNEPAGWPRDLRLGRLLIPIGQQDLSRTLQADPSAEEQRVSHEEVRNIYGQQECRATRAFLDAARPERRAFVLTRSGHAGIQRYAAMWTGDNFSRWRDLRQSIPMLLNLSLSGVPMCGADIGGFALPCTPELYARWIQIGALYPFARTHSMWLKRRQEPWRFGRRVERIARDALTLRMRLLPYLYGLFVEAEETGAPPWRPLFYHDPTDRDATDVEDQVMIGPSLMVAPILDRGARERDVYFPRGRWTRFDDDTGYEGPARVRVAAPLERVPLFARAGSVIPTQSPVEHVHATADEPCVLEVFAGGEGTALLVEDDGETRAYETGADARTEVRLWSRIGGRTRIEIGRRQGAFEIPERRLRVSVRDSRATRAVYSNAEPLAERRDAPGFSQEPGRVDVRLIDRGEGHTLEIEFAP